MQVSRTYPSWWLNQPIWKIFVKLDHHPQDSGWIIKNIFELPPPRYPKLKITQWSLQFSGFERKFLKTSQTLQPTASLRSLKVPELGEVGCGQGDCGTCNLGLCGTTATFPRLGRIRGSNHRVLWWLRWQLYGCFQKKRGFFSPKWMVKIMETSIKMGWFGGKTHYFRKHPYINIWFK